MENPGIEIIVEDDKLKEILFDWQRLHINSDKNYSEQKAVIFSCCHVVTLLTVRYVNIQLCAADAIIIGTALLMDLARAEL